MPVTLQRDGHSYARRKGAGTVQRRKNAAASGLPWSTKQRRLEPIPPEGIQQRRKTGRQEASSFRRLEFHRDANPEIMRLKCMFEDASAAAVFE